MNILFVCTGNTCRSSMAEGIFKHLLKEKRIDNINVSSAGISAFEGDRANEKAVVTLNKRKINIESHRARQLTREMIEESGLILTMTLSHKNVIVNTVPESLDKTFTLKEYVYILNNEDTSDKYLDISDPFALDYSVYEQCANEIEELLITIIDKLILM